MKTLGVLCVVLLVAVFATSCLNEQATVTTAPVPENGVTLNPAPPSASGPFVIRGATTFAVFQVDYKKGISVVFGADMNEFCNGIVNFDVVNFMDVDTQDDALRIVEVLNGDVQASVWGTTVFDCGYFLNNAPLASGIAHLVSTDNDLLAFLFPETPNVNAYGWQAQGALSDASGGRYHFNAVDRLTWDGVSLATTKEVSKVNLVGVRGQ